MTDKTPTNAQQYLNVASQCAATATSELAKNVLVDDGSGTLRELLNDAADAIRAGWGQPAQKTVTVVPATGDVWLKHDDDLRYLRRVLEAGRQMTDVDQRAAIDIVQGLRVTARSMAVDAKKPDQAAEPVAWLRNTTDPQPHAVTNLKYRSAVDAKAGVEYIPVFAAAQPVAREPLTPDQIAEIADAAHREYDRLVSSGQCAPRWSAVFAHLLEMHHGIKGGQHVE